MKKKGRTGTTTRLPASDRLLRRFKAQAALAENLRAARVVANERGVRVHVPDVARGDLIAALATMPDEAFGWFVLACPIKAMTRGGFAQIWPDGMGGFSSESRASVEAVRRAADGYLQRAK